MIQEKEIAAHSMACFMLHIEDGKVSQLCVNADGSLSMQLMCGETISSNIPLGKADANNLQLLKKRLSDLQELLEVKY